MNDTQIDDRELDRLADGELSPAAMRELLTRLDQTDDGWKRAALALLEAQAMRMACLAVIAPHPVMAPSLLKRSESTQSVRGRRELFVVAAAVLVTCGLGLWTQQPVVQDGVATMPTAGNALETDDSFPTMDAVQMAFAGADGEWSDPVTVPVIDAADPAALPWLTMRPTIPDAMREKLAANGQRIREQQTWVPVELADGRRGVVPVTDVVVAPTSPSDYQ
ncbi:MAG TPA: hypothetical protein VM165_20685 [Planctomycetaceae bacterium]|nr:hypothetical protein [Planctomycetaceae bacterium]